MKRFALLLAFFMTVLFCTSAMAKKEVTRQMGGACGEDSGIIASCASGLECRGGSCQMKSFLSSATIGCKQAMKDLGDNSQYVAAHDGFCYIDSACRGLYEKAMAASSVTSRVLSSDGVDPQALAALDESDRSRFEAAVASCQQCGKCAIGRQFLGRGGY